MIALRKVSKRTGRSSDHSTQPAIDSSGESTKPAGKLRVCLITTEFHGLFRNGGIGTANTGLALALSEANFDVTVAFADADEDGPRILFGSFFEAQEKYRQLGIKLDFVPVAPMVVHGFNDCRSASYCIYLYLKEQGFDVVYFNDCGGHGYYSLLAKHAGTFPRPPRMYVVSHGAQEWVLNINSIFWSRPSIITSFLEQRSVELADALISPSQFMVDWMSAQGWTLPAQVKVIQNIVPVPGFAPVPTFGTKPVSVDEIVFFGRLEVRKGIELFCDAIDLLNSSADLAGIKITLMGKFGHVAGLHSGIYAVERARHWRSPLRILSKYAQEEALSYLSRPGILAVIASSVENSPCVVSECLQLGIPFIATASGGTAELIAPADRDICLVTYNSKALAEKIKLFLSSGLRTSHLAVSQEVVKAEWLLHTAGQTHQEEKDQSSQAFSSHAAHGNNSEVSATSASPLVSICLVNSSLSLGAKTLIDSLYQQTYPNLEIVLLDDRTEARFSALAGVESHSDQIPFQHVAYLASDRAAKRNAAAAHASGDYLLFVDSDHLTLVPECIQQLVGAAIQTGANVVTALGFELRRASHKAKSPDGQLHYFPVGNCAELAAFENCLGEGIFLIDRQSFKRQTKVTALSDQEIGDWLFLTEAVLAGLQLVVCPEPLFHRAADQPRFLAGSEIVEDRRRILAAFHGQRVEVFRHAIEAIAQLSAPSNQQPRIQLRDASSAALEIAQRASSYYEPNSDEALRALVQFLIERGRVTEALDFALYNQRSVLDDAIGAVKHAAEIAALDSIRQNALEMWHEIDLSQDLRQRIFAVSLFASEELERPADAIISHRIDHGVKILKSAAVCPPLTQSLLTVAVIEASGPVFASLAVVISAPNAHLRLAKGNLESNDPFWWSGWIEVPSQGGLIELPVALPEPAKALLDLHFLCLIAGDEKPAQAKLTWQSVTARLLVNGAVTSSAIESAEIGRPISRRTMEQGVLLTEHLDFPFPVFVPGDETLLHPLPGRPTLVRIRGALPVGSTGVRSVVSIQLAEAHPVQFAVWAKSSTMPAGLVTDFTEADSFSGWFPVMDHTRKHTFTLDLSEQTTEPMDLYLSTRVVDFQDVHFCHAVWHELSILSQSAK